MCARTDRLSGACKHEMGTRRRPESQNPLNSSVQEIVWIDSRLLQNRAERSFGHVRGVIRHRSIAICSRVEPSLMTAGGLAVEQKSACLQLPNNLSVPESRERPIHAATTIV